MDALNTVSVWEKIYKMQLSSHGMGYASTMALSGIDIALWILKENFSILLYRIIGWRKE